MTDTPVQATEPAAVDQSSTILNPETAKTPSGAGAAPLREEGTSIQSVLEAELKTIRDADAKAEQDKAKDDVEKADTDKEKSGKDVKAKADDARGARDEKGKFAKADASKASDEDGDAEASKGEPAKAATGQEGQDRQRQSEGRDYHQPPARFLPKAKELWANVPNAVKADIHRLAQEHEAEVSQYRQNHEAYEQIREFDELARHGGTTLRNALSQYVGLENLVRANPVQGIAAVLRNIGLTPREYAEHVLRNPEAHNFRPAAPQPQQAPQTSAELNALKAEIAAMREDQVTQALINPFRAQNPRFDELQGDIAFFLTSGRIPSSLSPQERLEAAYDMAVRINPASSVAAPRERAEPDGEVRVPSKDAGTKSVRGAPNNGADTVVEEPVTDVRDMIRKEMRKLVA